MDAIFLGIQIPPSTDSHLESELHPFLFSVTSSDNVGCTSSFPKIGYNLQGTHVDLSDEGLVFDEHVVQRI